MDRSPILGGRDQMLADFEGKPTVLLRIQNGVPLWRAAETIGELCFRAHRVLRRSENGAIPETVLERSKLPLEPPE